MIKEQNPHSCQLAQGDLVQVAGSYSVQGTVIETPTTDHLVKVKMNDGGCWFGHRCFLKLLKTEKTVFCRKKP